jgi:hypothetical protein
MKTNTKVEKLSTFFETLSTSPKTTQDQVQSISQTIEPDPPSPSPKEAHGLPISRGRVDRDFSATGENVATELGAEVEIHSNSGKDAQEFVKSVSQHEDISTPTAAEEKVLSTSPTTPVPPITPRNPARLLRHKLPGKAGMAHSRERPQQQPQLNDESAFATPNNSEDDAPIVVGIECTHVDLTDTTAEGHNLVEKKEFGITDECNECIEEDKCGATHEGRNSTEEDQFGLGIIFESTGKLNDGGNSIVETIFNLGEGHNSSKGKYGFDDDGDQDDAGNEFGSADEDQDNAEDEEGVDVDDVGVNIYPQHAEQETSGHAQHIQDEKPDAAAENDDSSSPKTATEARPEDIARSPAVVAQHEPVAAPEAEAVSSTSSPAFNYQPFVTGEPPHQLIDRLLEQNYRGQAETFTSNNSRASIRSLSLSSRPSEPASTRSVSESSLIGTFYTPTRRSGKGEDLLQRTRSLRTPSGATRAIIEPSPVVSNSGSRNRSGLSPSSSPHVPSGHPVYTVPKERQTLSVSNRPSQSSQSSDTLSRGAFHFTSKERQAIDDLVNSTLRECEKHKNCIECLHTEYAYHENKALPTTMSPEERNKIISNNRSLRNIKNVRKDPRIFSPWPC